MAITSVKTGSSFTNLKKYDTFLGPNQAYMPSSFESIATIAASAVSTITFSSIPATYKSLQLRYNFNASWVYGNYRFQFNGSTATSYFHWLGGQGSYVAANGSSGNGIYVYNIASVAGTTYPNSGIMDLHDYASTTKNKTLRNVIGTDSNGSGVIELNSGLWASTAAVNSITFSDPGGGTFTGTFALYGIK